MKIFFVGLFMLINLISLSCASDSEEEHPTNLKKLEKSHNIEIDDDEENIFLFQSNNIITQFLQEMHTSSISNYTDHEIDFLNSFEEKTQTLISDQDIYAAFLECHIDHFSSYLTIKKKILYIHKFLSSSFDELKTMIQSHEKISFPADDPKWSDYLLNFILTKMTHPKQKNVLNLEQFNPNNSDNKAIFFDHLKKLHFCALSLCQLLAQCPTEIFIQNEDELKDLYPHFYHDYQTTKQNVEQNNISTKKTSRLSASNLSVLIDDFIQNLIKKTDPQTLADFTPSQWEEKALELKNIWDPKKEKKIDSLNSTLLRFCEKTDDPTLKSYISNLGNAANRLGHAELWDLLSRKEAELTKNKKQLLQQVEKLMNEIEPNSLKKFTPKQWEEKALELKNLWDPKEEKKIESLRIALRKLSIKNIIDPIKTYVSKLASAAEKLASFENNKKDLSNSKKKLLQHVEKIIKEIEPNSLKKFTPQQWEEKAMELKKIWDPKDEKRISALQSALRKISYNKNIETSLNNYVQNFMNAARRLEKKEKIKKRTKKKEKPTQTKRVFKQYAHTLLDNIEKIIKQISPDALNIFTKEQWEEKALELKKIWDPKDEKNISGLRNALQRLLTNTINDSPLKLHIHNLLNASLRLEKRIKKEELQKSTNESDEEIIKTKKNKNDLLDNVQQISQKIKPNLLDKIKNKEWEEKIVEIQKNLDSEDDKDIHALYNQLRNLSTKKDINPTLKPYFINLSNAARRIRDRKTTKKSIEIKEASIKKNENSELGKRVKNQSDKQTKKKKKLDNTSIEKDEQINPDFTIDQNQEKENHTAPNLNVTFDNIEPSKPSSLYPPIEKDEQINSDFTIDQNQEKENHTTPNLNVIFDNVEPSKPSSLYPPNTNNNELNNPDLTSHQILEDLDDIMTPGFDLPIPQCELSVPQNNLLLTNNSSFNNGKEILIKIKKYVRPTFFDIHSSLQQLVVTEGFFTVVEKQIFDFVDSPRILMMLTDVLTINSFHEEHKRRSFEIISNFKNHFM